jgi:hypothetical protein
MQAIINATSAARRRVGAYSDVSAVAIGTEPPSPRSGRSCRGIRPVRLQRPSLLPTGICRVRPYAYLYLRLSALGIDVLGESQLVGYPTQFPDVSMMDWTNGKPNARYWVLKLLKSTLGPGDTLMRTVFTDSAAHVESMESMLPAMAAQAYRSPGGQRKLLLVNKRDRTVQIALPADTAGGRLETVDTVTAEGPARAAVLAGPILELAPFAVAVVSLR